MITLIPKTGVELLIIEVSARPSNFRTRYGGRVLSYWGDDAKTIRIELPGFYSFIATTKDITERQAQELFGAWFVTIDREEMGIMVRHHTEVTDKINALKEHIQSVGCDPNKNVYAILKKI